MTAADVIAWTTKNAVKLVAGLVIALLLGFVAYKVFFAGGAAKTAVATANGQAAVSAAGAASAHDAVQVVAGNAAHEATIHDTVRIDHETIIHEPGAQVPVSDDLDAAGRRAICLHDSAAGVPDCERLRRPGP